MAGRNGVLLIKGKEKVKNSYKNNCKENFEHTAHLKKNCASRASFFFPEIEKKLSWRDDYCVTVKKAAISCDWGSTLWGQSH